ncbi:MAG: restriction endonuclease subunit S [bacterium]
MKTERTKNNIPEGWKMATLGEVLNIRNGKTRPEDGKKYPVYGGNGVLGYADKYNIDEEMIIIGRVGAYCGSIFIEKGKFWLSDNAIGILGKEDSNINLNFLHYLLKKINLNKQSIGGAQPLLTQGIINQIEVFIPKNKVEQHAIAAVLSSFDDKIELLREQNKTLEAIAQALYKRWFVDFEFPNEEGKPYKSSDGEMVDSELGEIPKGWNVGNIGDLCSSIANGGTPKRMEKSYWNGEIAWFKTGELSDMPLIDSEEHIAEEGLKKSACKLWGVNTILIALYASPTVGRLGILKKQATSNQACSGLIAKPNIGYQFLFYTLYFKKSEFNNISVGAAQQNINKAIVEEAKTIIPPEKLLARFNALAGSLIDKQTKLLLENKSLSQIRDSLLPRLMSGKIRVPIGGGGNYNAE